MLQLLHIEDIAIIESADISFEEGFNVLTGETGAGKSIVIDSLSAVLGQRASRELIRTGCSRACVIATFINVPTDVWNQLGVKPEEKLVLRREIYVDGENTCRANGHPLTVTQLRGVGNSLLNIHGQHDSQQLLDEDQHLNYLDAFGRTNSYLKTYQDKFHVLQAIRHKINALKMDEAEKARRIDTLRYQIDEMEKAKLQVGEEQELLSRRNFLRNSEKFISAVNEADYCLNGSDNENGIMTLIRETQDAIGTIKDIDPVFSSMYSRLDNLYSEMFDIADTIRDQKDNFDFSPHELDEVENRLDQLYRLKKKYGPTVEEIISYLQHCKDELNAIEGAEDILQQMEKDKEKALNETRDAAKILSQHREVAAKKMEKQILSELQQLDMGKIQFQVEIERQDFTETGIDNVHFLMSANLGEELRPIHKIASGGELARIMLAMKNVLAEQDQVGTLVFDEVDTGVSGRAAQKVAEKMARISRKKQVLCVTHLPQLAAMADTHFSVEKGEVKGRTFTKVNQLNREQRRAELARLTGGIHVSNVMLSGAEELLSEAENFKQTLR